MEEGHTEETLHALRFGQQCSLVQASGQLQAVNSSAMVKGIAAELSQLEEQIRREERWENRVVTRLDAEDGEEKVLQSVLVGAEQARARYEHLLALRDELLGVAS